MELRPGNAGSNTASDHVSGLSAALAQVPARYRRNVIVRLDGAGASHDFIEHMLNLEHPGRETAVHLRLDHHGDRRGRHPGNPGRGVEARRHPGRARRGRHRRRGDHRA